MCVVVEKVHFFARPEWIRIYRRARSPDSGFGARARDARTHARTNATEARGVRVSVSGT
jgi:hypothetical protein